MFLVNQLGIADRKERIQAFETRLGFPRPRRAVRPRAETGVPAAGALGHAAARSAVVATRAGDGRGIAAKAQGGRRALEAAPQLRRRAGRRTQVGAHAGRKAAATIRLRISGRFRPPHPAGLGRGRVAAGIQRQFQQVRRQQGPPEAGGHRLSPPAAVDPPLARVPPLGSARSRCRGLALRPGRSRRSAHGKLPRGRSHQHGSRAWRRSKNRSKRRRSSARGFFE